MRFPAYFSYPFERVISSRFEYLIANNIPPKAIGLDRILRFGDEDFIKIITKDEKMIDDYRNYVQKRYSYQNERTFRIRKRMDNETQSTIDKNSQSSNDSSMIEVDGRLVDLSQSPFNDDSSTPISS